MGSYCTSCEKRVVGGGEICPRCGQPLTAMEGDSLIGLEIDDKFRIESLIGYGGMGAVYRARQVAMGRDVAIKVLRPGKDSDERYMARFEREARAASRLSHPNNITVYDFGRTPDGQLYLVMEFLSGVLLSDQLSWLDPYPLERAVHVCAQICDALAEAHALGIVHRDLKPANIMLVRQHGNPDFVKVLDFGIAKLPGTDTSPPLTAQGDVIGTAAYMSPEQVQALEVDARSDLYALGVIFYQLVSGQLPFHSDNIVDTMMMHLSDPVPPIAKRNPLVHVPPAVDRFCQRALAKDPRDRFSDAAALKEALLALPGAARIEHDERTETAVAMAPTADEGEATQVAAAPVGLEGEIATGELHEETTARAPFAHFYEPVPQAAAEDGASPAAAFTAEPEQGEVTAPDASNAAVEARAFAPMPEPTEPLQPMPPPAGPLTRVGVRVAGMMVAAGAVALVLLLWRGADEPTSAAAVGAPDTQVLAEAASVPPVTALDATQTAGPDAAAASADVSPDRTGWDQQVGDELPVEEWAAEPEREQVRLLVEAYPTGAEVLWDGEVLCRTPCDVLVARGGGEEALQLQLPGYRPLDLTVDLAGDETRIGPLRLHPLSAATRPAHPTGKSRPALAPGRQRGLLRLDGEQPSPPSRPDAGDARGLLRLE